MSLNAWLNQELILPGYPFSLHRANGADTELFQMKLCQMVFTWYPQFIVFTASEMPL